MAAISSFQLIDSQFLKAIESEDSEAVLATLKQAKDGKKISVAVLRDYFQKPHPHEHSKKLLATKTIAALMTSFSEEFQEGAISEEDFSPRGLYTSFQGMIVSKQPWEIVVRSLKHFYWPHATESLRTTMLLDIVEAEALCEEWRLTLLSIIVDQLSLTMKLTAPHAQQPLIGACVIRVHPNRWTPLYEYLASIGKFAERADQEVRQHAYALLSGDADSRFLPLTEGGLKICIQKQWEIKDVAILLLRVLPTSWLEMYQNALKTGKSTDESVRQIAMVYWSTQNYIHNNSLKKHNPCPTCPLPSILKKTSRAKVIPALQESMRQDEARLQAPLLPQP